MPTVTTTIQLMMIASCSLVASVNAAVSADMFVEPLTPGMGDGFGASVAIGDSYYVAGAPTDDDVASDAGSVTIYICDSSGVPVTTILEAPSASTLAPTSAISSLPMVTHSLCRLQPNTTPRWPRLVRSMSTQSASPPSRCRLCCSHPQSFQVTCLAKMLTSSATPSSSEHRGPRVAKEASLSTPAQWATGPPEAKSLGHMATTAMDSVGRSHWTMTTKNA